MQIDGSAWGHILTIAGILIGIYFNNKSIQEKQSERHTENVSRLKALENRMEFISDIILKKLGD